MEGIEALIHLAANPDAPIQERQEAFGQIVNHFQDMAYGRAYAMLGDFHLAQDAAQEAFIEAWRNLPHLHDARAFPGWLKRIVIRQCSRLTRRRALATASLEAALDVPSSQPDPQTVAEETEVKEMVRHAVKSLSEPERTTTTLFYIDGYTQPEIANFLEVPVTTVNMRLHRARKHLKERMVAIVQDTLHGHRPSRNATFVKQVLFKAIREADAAKVEALIEAGADLSKKHLVDVNGETLELTPLGYARRLASVRLLSPRSMALSTTDTPDEQIIHVLRKHGAPE